MRSRILAVVAAAVLAVAGLAIPAGSATNDTYNVADPTKNKQWALTTIRAETAWPTADGTGALVAVVDTGVDLGHPDLDGKVVTYNDADFSEPNGTCTSGRKGQKTCVQDGPADMNGHGTHVAGIIAAETNNGTGIAGVAPGARILPVRVLDAEGSGGSDEVAAGIRYAADKGAKVINLSLGFLSGLGTAVKVLGVLDPVYDAIDHAAAKGAVVVIAAGNDTVPLCAEPAFHSAAICVGSTDRNDLPSYFSNTDAALQSLYLTAPGGAGLTCAGDIFSTVLRTIKTYCSGGVAGYDAYAGTSMATPHVAGLAALLAGKGLSRAAILDCFKSGRATDDLGAPGRDGVYGYGRINAAKAVVSC